METKWQRLRFHPCIPLGDDGRVATASKKHVALSRKAAGEGMVLLKNENNLLPLKHGAKVALFGKASADYVRGGGGSGEVTTPYTHNLCDAIETKEQEQKVYAYHPLHDFYRINVKHQYEEGVRTGHTKEPELDEKLLKDAKARTDVAIISICRFSSEGSERKGLAHDGDFYLSPEEEKLVEQVTNAYDHIVVVFNVGGMVDTAWCCKNPKIEAVLLGWQAGMEGADAEADILVGDVCPSGKLTDTFASSFDDYPSSANFMEDDAYAEYTEDIYVGYRYFETIPGAKEKVNYPFGFGLSYTTFDIQTKDASMDDDAIHLTINIANTGKIAGKEVVQIYVGAPQGKLGKPTSSLVDFKKTILLQPGENRDLYFDIKVSDLASFDDLGVVSKSAMVLEKGQYLIYVGNSVENKEVAFSFMQEEDEVVEQLHSYCAPRKLTRRMKADGTYEQLQTSEYDPKYFPENWPNRGTWGQEHLQGDFRGATTWGLEHFGPPYMKGSPLAEKIKEGNYLTLQSVADGKCTLDELLDQMSELDYIDLVSGTPNVGVSDVSGFGGLIQRDVPAVMAADGPQGVRIPVTRGIGTTAFPCGTVLACTWNQELVEEVGAAGGLELKENNLAIWLTPALNIHRNPLCGRNFEYYSEDPVVSGKIAAALIRGIQSNGVGACAKHFCCNNKETNRGASDSRVSERALREIYLKGFEILVKESQPLCIMTSYNLMNGFYTSENKELLTGILREEWGFLGMVMTDWVCGGEHYREVIAGNDVKMPAGSPSRLVKALEEKLITKEDLRLCAKRVLEMIMRLD